MIFEVIYRKCHNAPRQLKSIEISYLMRRTLIIWAAVSKFEQNNKSKTTKRCDRKEKENIALGF